MVGPVTLEGLAKPTSRVLDVGARDAGVADAFARVGAHHYLGLVLASDQDVLDRVPDHLQGRFHPMISPDQIFRNDTDLLVLRAPAIRAVWAIRDLTHTHHIVLERASATAWLQIHGALAISRLMGRIDHLGTTTCGPQRFEVFKTSSLKRPRPRPRHYLSETVGVSGLIRRLEQDGLDYVVLRWFDDLPHLDSGEDLDILVADRDLTRLHEILAEEPGTIPVDVYSESGLEGADFLGMAYYPPHLAAQMLARAEEHRSGARVPSPEDHLHSLAYHAVYHKGAASGLASDLVEPEKRPDHDYAQVLTRVAHSLGRSWPTSLEGVDEELTAQGWRPPLDTLRRLTDANAWVQHRFFPQNDEAPPELPEPTIFFIRERALSALGREETVRVIESLEFEILLVRELSGQAGSRTTELVRGGNWGRGPFPVSGGDPVMVVVAAHYGPRPPNRELLARYPRLTNGDVLHAKVLMRELVESRFGTEHAFNPVHSSDDEFETWEYLKTSLPDEVEAIRGAVRSRRDDYRTTVPVLAVLSRGRRAKVEVVEGSDGHPVVRKTFAPHGQRHMAREVETMRALASRVSAVPELLRTGPNWFETEFFTNDLAGLPDRPSGRLVPLSVARSMVEVLRQVHAQGFDLIDAKPQNFLLAPGGQLRLVDFEFSHRYPGEAPPLDEIYSFTGPPKDFDGDLPYGELSYESRWEPFTGLSRQSLLYDPVWRQHLHRSIFRAVRLSGALASFARSCLRQGRGRFSSGRAHAGAAYRQWARQRARFSP